MTPVHWSALSRMRQSPAHYRHYLDAKFKPTPAMLLGTIVHQIILGAREGKAVVIYEDARRGKAWTDFKAEHEGDEIVTRPEYDKAELIAEAVLANETVAGMLKHCAVERSMCWTINGRECAGTPDLSHSSLVADLKVTASADPRKVAWHARDMGWLGQLAWYDNAMTVNGDDSERAMYIIAVESKPPHCVTPMMLTTAAENEGRRLWRSCWERLAVCEENNDWPGYVRGIAALDVPEEMTLTIDGEEVEL